MSRHLSRTTHPPMTQKMPPTLSVWQLMKFLFFPLTNDSLPFSTISELDADSKGNFSPVMLLGSILWLLICFHISVKQFMAECYLLLNTYYAYFLTAYYNGTFFRRVACMARSVAAQMKNKENPFPCDLGSEIL